MPLHIRTKNSSATPGQAYTVIDPGAYAGNLANHPALLNYPDLNELVDATIPATAQYAVYTAMTVTKAANYTITRDDSSVLCDAVAGGFTVTLPPVTEAMGQTYTVKKIDASGNSITIDGNGSELIEGSLTQTLDAQWEAMTVQCMNGTWYIINEY